MCHLTSATVRKKLKILPEMHRRNQRRTLGSGGVSTSYGRARDALAREREMLLCAEEAMLLPFSILVLASQLLILVADNVPEFNIIIYWAAEHSSLGVAACRSGNHKRRRDCPKLPIFGAWAF